jgi:hypothetical protein
MTSIRYLAIALMALAVAGCHSSPANSGDSGVDMAVSDASGGSDGGADLAPGFGPESVLQHHKHPSRDGLYIEPAITTAAAAKMHIDSTFNAPLTGPVYAQPLYVDGGPNGRDLVIVATEDNEIDAFDAASGQVVWQKTKADLGTPAPLNTFTCGDIDPYGVTGTPVIDPASRTIFFDATTLDSGKHKHLVYGLSVDDGSLRAGWPVDLAQVVSGFNPDYQAERTAGIILGGTLYFGYGGYAGDCGNYYGYVIGFPLASPQMVTAWHTRALKAAIWAPGGLSSDGSSIFAVTGNAPPGTTPWGDEEAVIRLAPGPKYDPTDLTSLFYPTDWMNLDTNDIDLSGSGALLVDVPGATPSKLVVALGKDGKAYLLDRSNLGGMGGALASTAVASNEIIQAAATYATSQGTYVALKAACPTGPGNLVAFKITATSPPTITPAWCADQKGGGSPMVTTTDGHSQAVVWAIGTEQESGAGDYRLHGFDGDTGAVVYDGGGAGDVMSEVRRFSTPIAAKGRIFVASDDHLYAFTSP